jgi:phage shock protein B
MNISVFFFVIIIVGIVAGAVVAIAAMIKSAITERKHRVPDAEETQLIQGMHQSLTRLESRIESLETIIMDRERSEKLSAEINQLKNQPENK